MKRKLLIFLLGFLFIPLMYCQQVSEHEPLLDKIAKRFGLSIRQGTIDKNQIEKPASFQITFPGGNKSASYLIDIGVTLKLADSNRWFIGPLLEYHRQTETSKQQDNFQAGLTAFYLLGDVTKGAALFAQVTLTYKNDKISTGKGMLSKLNFLPLCPNVGIGSAFGLKEFKFLWQPSLGIQYESAGNVLKTGQAGKLIRTSTNIEIAVYPFANTLRRSIEILFRYSYWMNLSRYGAFRNKYRRDHNLFQSSLTCYLDDRRHFGLGINYIDGDNPEQGLLQQKATIISLKVKF